MVGGEQLTGGGSLLRLLHLSDLHLGWYPGFVGDKAAQRARERNQIISKAVDSALAAEVDLVIIAGDLFDNHKPEEGLVEQTIGELRRLEHAGIRLLTVPGNHDEITYSNSVYRRHASRWPGMLVQNPTPRHVASLCINGEDVHLYSLAYTGGVTQSDKPLGNLPRLNEPGLHIGVFHGSLDWNAGERSLPLSREELAKAGYNYTALGHFHRASQHRVGQNLISYCGSPEAKGFGDLGTQCLQTVDISTSEVTLKTTALQLRPQRVEQLFLDDIDSLHELDAAIAELADTNLILRLELSGSAAFFIDPTALASRHEHRFYHLEVRDETVAFTPQLLDQWTNELTVRGTFVRRMLQRLSAAETEDEKQIVQLALRRGLAVFGSEG